MNPSFETQIKAIQIADQMQQMLIPQINVINLITRLKLKITHAKKIPPTLADWWGLPASITIASPSP